jgi:hypothetical protein
MTITNTFLIPAFLIGVSFFFASCKIYYIPVDSFKQQFAGMDASNMREVITRGPIGEEVKYKTYPIDYIYAVDKNGNSVTIPNSPAIEIRFTDSANKRTLFYFDLMRIEGDNIIGTQSRIITSFKKSIPLASIMKIEVQNGKKNFSYIK